MSDQPQLMIGGVTTSNDTPKRLSQSLLLLTQLYSILVVKMICILLISKIVILWE
jgi:hypothetical protein